MTMNTSIDQDKIVDAGGVEAGTVVRELRRGYLWNDHQLLKVTVSVVTNG